MIVATIPAYNEKAFLEKAVRTLMQETASLDHDFRIVIAEDGSTDGSDRIARRLAESDVHVIHVHSDKKLGRGLALRNAWKQVKGDVYVFIDCDLATDMKSYPQLVRAIGQGFDLATGSRYIEGARVHRPALRYTVSRLYNLLMRASFGTHICDHQLGFKAFSRRVVTDVMDRCQSGDWFWDTEILVRSVRQGYRCLEFPVEWEEKKGKRTPLKRLIKDVYIHGSGFLKLAMAKN